MQWLIERLKKLEAAVIALSSRAAGPLGRFVRPPGQVAYTAAELDAMDATDEQRRIVAQTNAMDATMPPPEAGP